MATTEEQKARNYEYLKRYREQHKEQMRYRKCVNYSTKVGKDGLTEQQRKYLYYVENRDRMLEYNRKWRERNPERCKQLNRDRALVSKRRKSEPDTEKVKALFRDPAMKAHYQWLVDHARSKRENKSSI